MRKPSPVLLSAVLSALVSVCLMAADIPVTILDKDLDTPLEGVRISLPDGRTVLTDAAGKAVVAIPDDKARSRLGASLIGYEPLKFWLSPGSQALELRMGIAGVVEGAELVVEQAKPQKTDEQAGVSSVATRDEIRSTGEMGAVEDVMSTIKLLPGVGYSGDFDAAPSIRGGNPSELKCVWDGAYVLYPYHWGGAYSIFNPSMIDSAKLSNGLISASYGQALSGLLEVNSRAPANGEAQVNFDLSTTGIDLFTLIPFGDKSGLVLGGKATWFSVAMDLAKNLGMMNGSSSSVDMSAPYIRDAFGRFYLKPDNTWEWDLNVFLGSDGVAINSKSRDRTMQTAGNFSYLNYFQMVSTNLHFMVGQDGLLNILAAWNRVQNESASAYTYSGAKLFDLTFINTYHPATVGFILNNLDNSYRQELLWNTGQGKISYDWQLAPGQLVTIGAESVLTVANSHEEYRFWRDIWINGAPVFKQTALTIDTPDNRTLASGGYLTWDFSFADGLLGGELGLRLDHALVWNNDYSINTLPTFNPRLRLVLTPLRNLDWLDSLSVTAGSGLYSQIDSVANALDRKYGLDSRNYSPTRSWFNLLGVEAQLQDGWKFSAEGYYKYYFNRLYIVGNNVTNAYTAHTDGTGYAAGVDLMLQKRLSRYWDGWLTYSFSQARYKNPTPAAYAGQVTTSGEVLDQEFYPSWHRFHTLNLISNWKPVEGFAVMAKLSLATGNPAAVVGQIISYPAYLADGTMIERFTRSTGYSDSERGDLSCPIDVKLTWSGFLGEGKVGWEFYIGVQNILANVYSPRRPAFFDPWYGDNGAPGGISYDMNFPIPSIGFKLSY